MKLEAVTIKDIAKALNKSKSTVSRAFKNAPDVSTRTKKLILDYAEKINFSPNRIASGLKEGKSHSIGVVVSEIASPFFSQVINGIESVAHEKGYRVIITQSYESSKREAENVQELCSYAIDGLLISLSNFTSDISHLKKWHAKGLPIVFFDKVIDKIKTHSVVMNNSDAAFNATEHLIQEKFENIAHFAPPSFLLMTQQRLEGYQAALKKHNIPFNKNLVKYFDHGKNLTQEIEDALIALFASKTKPDAILATSDKITASCFQALKKIASKKVIGLAGFSNNELCSSLTPAITVIHQPAFEMGEIAMTLLTQLIESTTPVRSFEKKVLESDLLIRTSSKKDKLISIGE
jgi:LacI family transcriptional regulator